MLGWVLLLLSNEYIRLLDFKIRSIDRALRSGHFNASQEYQLLKLQNQLVLERYRTILIGDLE